MWLCKWHIRWKWLLVCIVCVSGLSCENPKAIVPYYFRVLSPRLIVENDTLEADIKDAWIYAGGRFVAAGEFPFEIPINDYSASYILTAGGVWESGIAIRRQIYPFWQFDTFYVSAQAEKLYVHQPIFRYVADTLLQPLLEETFESPQVVFRGWGNYTDTVRLQRSLDTPWRGFWCGKLYFPPNTVSTWSVVSPRSYTFSRRDTWLELRLKGTINLGVGLVITDRNGEVERSIRVILIPVPDRWQSYYINMTPWVQKIPDFQQFRLYFFTQNEDQKERFLYIDDVRWLTFRNP